MSARDDYNMSDGTAYYRAMNEIDRLRAQVERDRPVIDAARAWRKGREIWPTMAPERVQLIEAVDNHRAASAPDEVNEAWS